MISVPRRCRVTAVPAAPSSRAARITRTAAVAPVFVREAGSGPLLVAPLPGTRSWKRPSPFRLQPERERIAGPCSGQVGDLPGTVELAAERCVDCTQLRDVARIEEPASCLTGHSLERLRVGPAPRSDRIDHDTGTLCGSDRPIEGCLRPDIVTVGEQHENARARGHAFQP